MSVRTYSCQALQSEAGWSRRMPSSTVQFGAAASGIIFRDTEAFLKLAEAFNPAQCVANDQQRPPVADDIQRTGNGAGALFKAGTFTGKSQEGVVLL